MNTHLIVLFVVIVLSALLARAAGSTPEQWMAGALPLTVFAAGATR